mmetsp:Transcript_21874/g.50460  ORF Transcript_21874/g.50460 Transcript_21874/m.50460 type:complete len:83 (+) Transcript_21874:369-617(+)
MSWSLKVCKILCRIFHFTVRLDADQVSPTTKIVAYLLSTVLHQPSTIIPGSTSGVSDHTEPMSRLSRASSGTGNCCFHMEGR